MVLSHCTVESTAVLASQAPWLEPFAVLVELSSERPHVILLSFPGSHDIKLNSRRSTKHTIESISQVPRSTNHAES